jgi:hypothetical protein
MKNEIYKYKIWISMYKSTNASNNYSCISIFMGMKTNLVLNTDFLYSIGYKQ